MERNRNVDILRAFAVLMILVYHCFAVAEKTGIVTNFLYLRQFLSYSGEIGVTLFFIMSGFGITFSFYKDEKKGKNFLYGSYLKRRFIRIAPQYYVCLFVVLIFSDAAEYLRLANWVDVISHLTFTHNLLFHSSGAINGALWTMGTIVQFYLIAPCLYKLVKKYPLLTVVGSIILTIIVKAILFTLFQKQGLDDSYYYFIFGRQLYTALDNFVIGMALGFYLASGKKCEKIKDWMRILGVIASIVAIAGLLYISNTRNRLGNTHTAWLWYSCLAVVIGFIVWNFANMTYQISFKPLLWIAQYEYGIYLWHLPIIRNLLRYSDIVKALGSNHIYWFTFFIILLACLCGYFSTEVIDGLVKRKMAEQK